MIVTGVGVDELVNVDRVDGRGKVAVLVKVLDERGNLDEAAVVDESEDGTERSENEYVDEYDESVGVCRSAELDRFEDEVVESIDELNESDELVDLVVEK